jgi:hypothetical protein
MIMDAELTENTEYGPLLLLVQLTQRKRREGKKKVTEKRR